MDHDQVLDSVKAFSKLYNAKQATDYRFFANEHSKASQKQNANKQAPKSINIKRDEKKTNAKDLSNKKKQHQHQQQPSSNGNKKSVKFETKKQKLKINAEEDKEEEEEDGDDEPVFDSRKSALKLLKQIISPMDTKEFFS